MAVLFKGALLAGLLCSCVVAGSYLPRRGCIDIAAPWMERQPGQRWSPETGECSELACHPEGAVTVTSCHVGTPPPGCTLEAAKKGAVFPECCPRVRCLSDTRKARKDSWNSLTPSSLSLLSSLGVLTSYSAPLRHPPHRPADTAGRPITGAAPAQWPLNQVLSADHAGTTETVPKAEAPHRVADTGAPVMVAGRPITGKALRFYNKFLGRTPAASKSPVPGAWAATSRSLPLDGLLPFGEMFPLEEMLLSLDGMLPFEDDLLLGKLLLDGLPRDRDNELQVESPTMVVSTQQKETL